MALVTLLCAFAAVISLTYLSMCGGNSVNQVFVSFPSVLSVDVGTHRVLLGWRVPGFC